VTLRRLTLVASVLGVVLLLSACRVDVVVRVDVNANGSGNITVTATADKDIVTAEPTLATDLRLEDILNAGWKVQKPKKTSDGGLKLVKSLVDSKHSLMTKHSICLGALHMQQRSSALD